MITTLAIAWGNHIHILELKEIKKGLKFQPKMKFVLDTDIMGLEWLDNRVGIEYSLIDV